MKEEIEKVEEEKQQIEAHNDFIQGKGKLFYILILVKPNVYLWLWR